MSGAPRPVPQRFEAPLATGARPPAPAAQATRSRNHLAPAAPAHGRRRTIVVNAASIVGTYGVTSALGAVFWWLAAHRFAPSELGRASAIVSGMTLLASLSSLGLNTLLVGELRRQREPGTLLGSALVVSGVAGAGLALAYAFSIPHLVRGLRSLAESPLNVGVFVVGVVALSLGNTLDGALVGLLKAQLRLVRNTLLGLAKLTLLVVLGIAATHPSSVTIYAAWTLGAIVALIVPALGIRRFVRGFSLRRLRPRWSTIRGFRGVIGEHQLLNLGLNVPSLVLPLLVIGLLSARANASFYVAWMIVSVAFIVPPALTQILFAVSADTSDALTAEARMTMRLCLAAGVLAIAVGAVAASPILGLFGPTYAHDASWTLRVLLVGVLPLSVKDHYVALRRIRRQLRRALPLIWAGTAAELVLAAVGAKLYGLEGLSVGWLSAVGLEAVVMARPVYEMLQGAGHPEPTTHPLRALTRREG